MPARAGERSDALLSCTACGAEWPPPPPATDDRDLAGCEAHAGRPATAVCDRCGKEWCEACLGPAAAATRGPRITPCCEAAPVAVAGVRFVEPYWRDPLAVVTYPFRRKGVFMLLLFWLGGYVPLLSWILLILMAAYLQHILRRSAQDLDHLPDYPALVSVPETILYPLGRLLVASLVAWGPWLLFVRYAGGTRAGPVFWVLVTVGIATWPILAIVASLTPSIAALFDFPSIARAVVRIPTDYTVTCVVLAAIVTAGAGLGRSADANPVAGLASSFFHVYGAFVVFHVLGRMVLQTARRVDWAI